MMDFFKDMCTGDIWSVLTGPFCDHDPMVEEALAACAAAVSRPLTFSPPGILVEEELHSPVYTRSAVNWDKTYALNEEAAALGYSNVIHFGLGA
jgi:hypothetical protein